MILCQAAWVPREDAAETIAIDSNNQPKSPLEKFMVRLCTHHQKQFIRVLNDIYTEVQPDSEGQQLSESESMEASTCGSGCSQRSTENQDKGATCTESKPPSSSDPGQSGSDGPLHLTGQAPKQPAELKSLDRAESSSPALRRDFSELPITRLHSASPKDSSTQGYLSTLNSSSLNFHHATKSLEGQQAAGHEQEASVRKCEDTKEQLAGKTLVEGYISVKVANVNGSEDSLEGCLGSQKSSFRALPEESWDPGFAVTPPRRADKENTLQCSSKASLHQDLDAKEQDARPKQENHLHAMAKGKAGCHLHPAEKGPLDKSKEGWLPAGAAPAAHRTPSGHPRAKAASLRSTRKSKKASGLRINDYDNQCDVVYISQPITECHFESQRSVSSRKTARKSTRGYYFNGECCELPTVRTLVRSSRGEERGSSPALRTETLEVDVKPDNASAKDEESSDSAMDTSKLESCELVANLLPCPSSRGGSKHLPAKAAKHKKVALQFYNLRHTPAPVETAKKSTPGKESTQAVPKLRDEWSSGNDDFPALEDIDSKPKFMEWCAEEENQELIAEFNAQYMKVQKGWIQLEKEVQPTPKVKSKADKLKEIWKSKKRTRKSRGSLEVQKLSPVQMLFMKAFKLSDICQWFLETTETRSLVIVKKLNTRLPGEIPPIKVPMQKYSSSGLYPSSLQAERLKKHLKKFAATTPARNNLKNQKLWAKIRENADKAEAEEAISPSQTPLADTSAENLSEDKTIQPVLSLPTQASTRILRKYSNLRGKLRAQHRVVKAEKKSDGPGDHPSLESKQSRKSVCINPLMSPKLAMQIKADAFPARSPSVDGMGKGRKGKGRSQEDPSPKADLQLSRKKRTLKESGSTQERSGSSTKDKLPAKKASKIKHLEVGTKAPATRKQAAMERSNKLARKMALKEKRAPKRQLEKVRLPMRKGKENTSRRAVLPPGHEELAKSPKQKPLGESSTRAQKMANKKPSGGKTLTRSMKKMQESSGSQGKRKLRAKVDCSHSKRSRLDPK
ncbi:hypothetical protein llap_14197 [Limosa lapponica baueri]|uniref:Ligand-dependent corepressor n=1 Tax=Limosa lapponica baueri TaxID=1758121 RepID=A0A2I0TNU4_LIMLA|nr:hypothetical protein llap_14197 [Limosa lapponica baueri]